MKPGSPQAEPVHIWRFWVNFQARHRPETVTCKGVKVPLCAVREDAHIALLKRRYPGGDVPSELLNGLSADIADPEVAFHLENCETYLDIDTTPLTRG